MAPITVTLMERQITVDGTELTISAQEAFAIAGVRKSAGYEAIANGVFPGARRFASKRYDVCTQPFAAALGFDSWQELVCAISKRESKIGGADA